MIASLPMYDRPETRAATDRLWSAIAARLRGAGYDAPAALLRDADRWDTWQSPDLLLSQTCGLPYRTRLHGKVALVGTPDYGLSGCPKGYYCSVIVARAGASGDPASLTDALDGARLAYNDGVSQSGWAAPLDWAARHGLRFGALVETGSHAASVAAVAEGRADLAGIDAVTWRLLTRHDPVAQDLRGIAHTPPTPGLPLITAPTHDPAPIAAAVAAALVTLGKDDRAALGLTGLTAIPPHTYLAQNTPPSPAVYAETLGA